MATTCIIRSVTLQPNEEFILPPGAELISVSDIGNITTTCNVDNLEELQCYVCVLGINDDETADRYFKEGNPGGMGDTFIKGFYLNDSYTEFPSPLFPHHETGFFDASQLLSLLQSYIPGIISGNWYYENPNGAPPMGEPKNATATLLQIKTIPSIAENLYIYILATADTGQYSAMTVRVPFYTLDAAEALGVFTEPLTELCSET